MALDQSLESCLEASFPMCATGHGTPGVQDLLPDVAGRRHFLVPAISATGLVDAQDSVGVILCSYRILDCI